MKNLVLEIVNVSTPSRKLFPNVKVVDFSSNKFVIVFWSFEIETMYFPEDAVEEPSLIEKGLSECDNDSLFNTPTLA